MKKTLLTALAILILSSTVGTAYSKTTANADVASAIRLYKAGNYTGCYAKLDNYIKRDKSNALAYYYLAMSSAQMGKEKEAIEFYDSAINIATPNTNLHRYAIKGKRCLEDPEKCQEPMFESEDDAFILSNFGTGVSKKVQSEYERLKIENMMREINRSDEVDPQEFRGYKDFSSMNDAVPSNDEIVNAIRTLQRAGMGNIVNNNYSSDIALLTGNNQQSQLLNLMGAGNLSPQVIQAMLSNNMSLGF